MLRAPILLLIALLTACAGPGTRESIATRRAVAENALAQLGVPYRYGGADRNGFDCSGLVQFAYFQAGVQLPHGTGDLRKIGAKIAYSDARVGDLLFYTFKDRKNPSMHVAIYLGDDWMVHAPASGGQVAKIRVDEKPWPGRYVGAVRILP